MSATITLLTAVSLLTTGPYPPDVPPPGGYHPGLTRTLAAPSSVRLWGPDIPAPSPGGYVPGVTRPPAKQGRLWGPDLQTPPPGGVIRP